ncbi:hypothetical protein MKZ38_008530 [Zalerion maritima]|uniref:CCHC-type domain-containing protein n=1 Tax=Zalerion maritima TaxID=339359 RepID=A0AAD5S2B3_9PEZI|nr:hypothetical protein MKZ38_008530 [Zalerion maritima]
MQFTPASPEYRHPSAFYPSNIARNTLTLQNLYLHVEFGTLPGMEASTLVAESGPKQLDPLAQGQIDSGDSKASKRPAEDMEPNADEKRQKTDDLFSKPNNDVPGPSSKARVDSLESESNSDSEPELDPTPKVRSSAGWNTGVSTGGIRIGFSTALTPGVTTNTVPDILKSSPTKTVVRQKRAWTLPGWPKGQEVLSWDSKLETWAELFADANKPAIRKLKVSDFQFLALSYLDINLSKAQKKHCRASLMKYIRAGKWDALVEKSRSRPPSVVESASSSSRPTSSKLNGDLGQTSFVDVTRIGEPDGRKTKRQDSVEGSVEKLETGSSDEGEVSESGSESEDEGLVIESEDDEGEVDEKDLNSKDRTNRPENEQELSQLRRYFPGFADSDLCLSCKGAGHDRNSCPFRTCRWCGETDSHRFLGCPRRTRCKKCRQLGHRADECNEKLKATAEHELQCRHCDGEHRDAECDLLWRTSYPDPAKVNKVKYLPASCYACGKSGHYGAECPSRDIRVPVSSANFSWTEKNRTIYLDPGCDKHAIAYGSGPEAPFTAPPALPMKIRGKARHVEYTDDDDSDDEGLIRAPISKSQPRSMTFATNIQHTLPALPPQSMAPSGGSSSRGGFSNLRRGGYRGGRYRGGKPKFRGRGGT